jgi:signal transduction histidine kinase/CheY-like chemotaxis protein
LLPPRKAPLPVGPLLRGLRRTGPRYTFGVATALLTIGIALALRPFEGVLPSPPFLLVVLVVAWFAGFGPAVVALGLGVAAINYFFAPPLYELGFTWRDSAWVFPFVIVGLVVARLAATRRRIEDERAASLAREQAARMEAEQAADRLRDVQGIVDTALTHAEFQDFLRAILKRVRRSLPSDTVTVLLLRDDGCHLTPMASDGLREELGEEILIPLGRGAAGRIAVSETGLIFEDLATVDVVSPFLRSRVRSLVGVPLRVGDRLIGVVHAGSCSAYRFGEDDLDLLRLVADRVAIAIERERFVAAEREARASAERANLEKDEFLAVLGHELRNPLSAIKTATLLLGRIGRQDETAVQARDVIARQVEHLARLVNDLLEVNRVMAGKIVLERRAIDLAEAVRRSIATLSGAGRMERHALAVDAEAVWVEADAVRLDQVTTNLVENAVKYTPAGGSIEIAVYAESGDAVLEVRDTGVGIPPELLPRIFDLFVQGEPGSRRARGGLGIGLAVVRRLIELHGGTVQASSRGPGQGSRFTVRLPRVPAASWEAPDEGRGVPEVSSRRVLIVEDHADERAMLRRLLESSGHEVHEAEDGQTAVRIAERVRPEIVLVDIGVPLLDGWEVAREIRTRLPHRETVLVAFTGYARPEDHRRSREAGFDCHLVKPVDPARLAEVMRMGSSRSAAD